MKPMKSSSRLISFSLTLVLLLGCLLPMSALAAPGVDADDGTKLTGLVAWNAAAATGNRFKTYLQGAAVPAGVTNVTATQATNGIAYARPTGAQVRIYEIFTGADITTPTSKLYFAPRQTALTLATAQSQNAYTVNYNADPAFTTISVAAGYEYKVGTGAWTAGGGAAFASSAFSLRVAKTGNGSAGTPYKAVSTALSVAKPAAWAAPTVVYDAVNAKLKLTIAANAPGYQWQLKTGGTWATLTLPGGTDLTKTGTVLVDIPGTVANNPAATIIQVRVINGNYRLASAGKDVTVPGKGPGAPTAGTGIGEIYIDYKTEMLMGLTTAYEYKLGTATAWTAGKANIPLITILNGLISDNTIMVREKAKTGIAAGTPVTIPIKARYSAAPTVTLDYEKGTLNITDANVKNYVFGTAATKVDTAFDSGVDSADGDNLANWVLANAGKKVYAAIRGAGTNPGGNPATFPVEISIPAKQAAPKLQTATVAGDYVIENGVAKALNANTQIRRVTETVTYNATTKQSAKVVSYGAWQDTGSDIDLKVDNVNSTGVGYYYPVPAASSGVTHYVQVRLKPVISSSILARFPSTPVKVAMTRAAAPAIALNWTNGSLTGFSAAKKYQYRVGPQGALPATWNATEITGVTTVPMTGDFAPNAAFGANKEVQFREIVAATGLASNVRTLVIPAASDLRPAVTTNYTFDCTTCKLALVTGSPAIQYSINDGATWVNLTAAGVNLTAQIEAKAKAEMNADNSAASSFKVLVRFTVAANTPPNPTVELNIPIQNAPTPAITHSLTTFAFTNATADHQYRLGTTGAWLDYIPSGVDQTKVEPKTTVQTVQFRLKADATRAAGKIQTILVAATSLSTLADYDIIYDHYVTPGTTVDPQLMLSVKTAVAGTTHAYRTYTVDTETWSAWTAFSTDTVITGYNGSGTTGVTRLELRKTVGELMGIPVALTLKTSAAAPTAPKVDSGAITGVTILMEYRKGTSGVWTKGTGAAISVTGEDTYEIRIAATPTAFYSKTQTINVPATAVDLAVVVTDYIIRSYTPDGGSSTTEVTNLEWSLNGNDYAGLTANYDLKPLFPSGGGNLVIFVRVKGTTATGGVSGTPKLVSVNAATGIGS
ncbi:MAG: hypothetical protein FWG32_05510 [Oscillospiraceae bacterium]|nr:hypothetical protein [Oscillospiraceae bacterium]